MQGCADRICAEEILVRDWNAGDDKSTDFLLDMLVLNLAQGDSSGPISGLTPSSTYISAGIWRRMEFSTATLICQPHKKEC